MNKKQVEDLVERAVWTFVQAFLAVLVFSPEPFSKAALIAAAAAGVSSLKSYIVHTS